jgi:hypothetical protein
VQLHFELTQLYCHSCDGMEAWLVVCSGGIVKSSPVARPIMEPELG